MYEMTSGAESQCKVHGIDVGESRKTMLFKNTAYIYFSGDTRRCPICVKVHISVCYLFNLTVNVEYQMNTPGQSHKTYSPVQNIFE